MANSKLMLQGRLDAEEFLNRIVYQQNSDDYGMLDVSLINVSIDQDDEDEEIEDILSSKYANVIVDDEDKSTNPSPTPSTLSTTSSKSLGQCTLCEAEPELLLLPCFEFCLCQLCWDILKKNNSTPACPNCRIKVASANKIKFSQ